MTDFISILPEKLKKGDKMNGYGAGWMTVKKVEKGIKLSKYHSPDVTVTFDTANGEKVIEFLGIGSEHIEVLREFPYVK